MLLNPKVDRLAMVCEMTISKTGEMTDYQFYEAVIHSQARLTYNKVSTILEAPKTSEAKALRGEYADVVPHLKQLYALYKVLLGARHVRGAIDFETQETRIVFGSERKIAAITPTTRNDAHKLIEECMLAANVATAEFLKSTKFLPCTACTTARRRSVWKNCALSSVSLACPAQRQGRPDAEGLPGAAGQHQGPSGLPRDPDRDAALSEPGGVQRR